MEFTLQKRVERKYKMKRKFLRRDAKRFAKFGKGRGKKAKWRNPTGRDNKLREKKKGYQAVPSIGYRGEKKNRGKIKEKTPVKIMRISDIEKVGKTEIGILGNVGLKKKIEIVKKANELKVELKNVNVGAFLKKVEKREKHKKKKSEEKKEEKTENKTKVEKKK